MPGQRTIAGETVLGVIGQDLQRSQQQGDQETEHVPSSRAPAAAKSSSTESYQRAAGKTAGQVFEDFKAFVAKVHGKLPACEVVNISQTPAPARWWTSIQAGACQGGTPNAARVRMYSTLAV